MPRIQRLLDSGVDAIVATSSGKVYDNIGVFLDRCNDAGVPVYCFNKTGVLKGAVAALAGDYYRMVDELILPMAMKVLREGVSPGDMPAAFLKKNVVYLNAEQAKKLKLSVPKKIVETAIFMPRPGVDEQ